MSFDYQKYGRFNNTSPVIKDGKETYGTWNKPEFVDAGDDTISFTVDNTTAGRPDLIANQVYGTPELYWVIIAVVRPFNTLNWPPTGTVLLLPGKSVVLNQI